MNWHKNQRRVWDCTPHFYFWDIINIAICNIWQQLIYRIIHWIFPSSVLFSSVVTWRQTTTVDDLTGQTGSCGFFSHDYFFIFFIAETQTHTVELIIIRLDDCTALCTEGSLCCLRERERESTIFTSLCTFGFQKENRKETKYLKQIFFSFLFFSPTWSISGSDGVLET